MKLFKVPKKMERFCHTILVTCQLGLTLAKMMMNMIIPFSFCTMPTKIISHITYSKYASA